jgi:hypothetical protein
MNVPARNWHPDDVSAGTGSCPICGTPDLLDVGYCAGCAGAARSGPDDRLLYLKSDGGFVGRRQVGDYLFRKLGGTVSRASVARTVSGERPLLRVSARRAPELAERLREHGTEVVIIPASRAWTRIPTSLSGLLIAILVAGGLTGLARIPVMLVTTPLFAVLLFLMATRRLREPLLPAGPGDSDLPPRVHGRVCRAAADLGPGRARDLLIDLVSLARGLHADREVRDLSEVIEPLDALLERSAAAAGALGALDESIAILVRSRDASRSVGAGPGLLTIERAQETADLLAAKLADAVAALGRARGAAALSARAAASELAERAREIETDLEVRVLAMQDVKRALNDL